MIKALETAKAPQPLSAYAQGIEIPAGHRVVHVSGQVGVDLNGNIPADAARQHELAWENALAVLAAAGMDHRNIVDAHVYITERSHLALYRATRDRFLKGHRPAATLLIVAGLADERLVVEVDLVAAAEAV
ncbi:RidA family protein [Aestuariivirga sp.]|uniref:RidA family protein n=1 Tax=Aestuariivirga sp. TaxID=2650926 RepID=UPI003BAC5C07